MRTYIYIYVCMYIYIENINKNVFNNFLITAPRHTLLFQKLLSPSLAPAPESENAPVFHRASLS